MAPGLTNVVRVPWHNAIFPLHDGSFPCSDAEKLHEPPSDVDTLLLLPSFGVGTEEGPWPGAHEHDQVQVACWRVRVRDAHSLQVHRLIGWHPE